MSFFDNIEVSTEYSVGGGDFEPIPGNTKLKAIIEEAHWDSYEGDNYISIRWSVLGGEYNNRKIFQKLKILDSDDKKAKKAKEMLAAIDMNAGGKIVASREKPDDLLLASSLVNKSMIIQLSVWEMNDRKGNWVNAVSSSKSQPEKQEVNEDIDF